MQFQQGLESYQNFRPHILQGVPSFRKSQILQISAEILTKYAFLTRILQVCTRIAIFASLLLC